MKTQLQYRTFDELMNEVITDFHIFDIEGMVDPAQLIKVAQRVSYDLGLRIHSTREVMLEVCNHVAKLPDDFYVLNFAMLCHKYTVMYGGPSILGLQRENVIVAPDSVTGETPCNSSTCCPEVIVGYDSTGEPIMGNSCVEPDCPNCCGNTWTDPWGQNKVYSVCDGTCVKVVEKCPTKNETREYSYFDKLYIEPSRFVDASCMNTRVQSCHSAQIKNGHIYTNIENGKIFMSYQGALVDDNGNLLVLDHPLVNEYYEYAIKQRILENLYFNGEDVERKMLMIAPMLKAARNNAVSMVNMPDFRELYQIWKTNRKAHYAKYYSPFKTYYGSI